MGTRETTGGRGQELDRIVVVSNAAAGSNNEQAVATAVGVWRDAGCDVEVVGTSTADELSDVIATVDGLVVAAGGDGSIHAAVQALSDLGRLDQVVVGILPLGTGNDLARGLGIPREPEPAARALLAGRAHPMDLLVAPDGTVGVNAINLGIGAAASERASDLKDGMGETAYPVGALAAGVTEPGWQLSVTVDDVVVVDAQQVLHVVIGNGPSLGGGTAAVPAARPDDGQVAVMVSLATGPVARAGYATDLRTGEHVDRDDVVMAHGTRVVVAGDEHPVNVDGELLEPRTESRWSLQRSAWSLRHPGADPELG